MQATSVTTPIHTCSAKTSKIHACPSSLTIHSVCLVKLDVVNLFNPSHACLVRLKLEIFRRVLADYGEVPSTQPL